MKLFVTSISGHDKTESQHYLRVLQRAGHQVFRCAVPAIPDAPRPRFYAESGFAPEIDLETLIKVAGFEPDLFLYIEPNGLVPLGMERAPFATACVLCDTHQWLAGRVRLGRFFDHVFLYHRNYLRHFTEHPPGYVHWNPYACDLELFRPLGVERDLDVAFIGQLDPRSGRRPTITRLQEKYRINEQREYLQAEIPSVYSRAKIVLNLPRADDLNFRTFEAMSCGAMLLTRRDSNGQESLFKEGVHYAAYADEQDLFSRLQYYLEHPDERAAIAAAGLAEIRLRHRLDQRVEALLSTVMSKREPVAPIRRMSPSQVDRQYAWLYELNRQVDPGAKLARQARASGRPWLPLVPPLLRSVLRLLFR